jgi:RsiW-degrading membrane proteinase PrsW (M82 family)
MSFFNFQPATADTPAAWRVSEMFWVYWVVAIPITVATVATWSYWQRKQQKGSR